MNRKSRITHISIIFIISIICVVCLMLLFPAQAKAAVPLLKNGGLERSSYQLPGQQPFTYWTASPLTGVVFKTSSHHHSGMFSCEITEVGATLTQTVPLPAHTTVVLCHFEAWISTNLTGTGGITLESLDVNGAPLRTWQWDDTNSYPNYTQKWADINFGPGEKAVLITLTLLNKSDPSGWTSFDDVSLSYSWACFIATAAYGSYLDPHVETLREFRDAYLLPNPVGSALVSLYYKYSPPLAEFIDEHPAFKPVVRMALLPAVGVSAVAMNTTTSEKIAILALITVFSSTLVVSVKQRRYRSKKK